MTAGMHPNSRAGAEAVRERNRRIATENARRRKNAERQKAALKERAYDDFRGSPADLRNHLEQMKADFLKRKASRRSAA